MLTRTLARLSPDIIAGWMESRGSNSHLAQRVDAGSPKFSTTKKILLGGSAAGRLCGRRISAPRRAIYHRADTDRWWLPSGMGRM
jgi:hypothetical protein